MFRLDGQVAIITGGAQGIGAGICEVFLNAGATVVIWDVIDAKPVINRLSDKGSISFQQVNVTDLSSVEAAANEVVAKHGRLDILINNAGVIRDKSFMKMSQEQWDTVVNVNINSLYVTAKAVIPHMMAAKYGRIVSASSINAVRGAFGQTNYGMSKAAIQGFTRSLCKEVGKHGITVNCVAPGFIKTAMTDSMPDEVVKAGIAQIPIRRIGTPQDMGYAYLFLASREAEFVNGTTLHANGGSYPT